jgi:uncharacterized protein affecting Mg2+/Co2+ transport
MMMNRAIVGAVNMSDREQWFFFCPHVEREMHSGLLMRTTSFEYWKVTGSSSRVFSVSGNQVIGNRISEPNPPPPP